MRRSLGILFALLLIGAWAARAEAADKLRVVATIPDLRSLTEEVGGDLVEVESLARGTQNAHELEIRPSLMLKLRRADMLIENGLELDAWADVAVQGANVTYGSTAHSRPGFTGNCVESYRTPSAQRCHGWSSLHAYQPKRSRSRVSPSTSTRRNE